MTIISGKLFCTTLKQRYDAYIRGVREDFSDAYVAHCLSAAQNNENFLMEYSGACYHWTLFYYDQSDNLVRTVPPEGVVEIDDPTVLTQAQNHRIQVRDGITITDAKVEPNHTLYSTYNYNSLNKIIKESTPDAGEKNFGMINWAD